MKKVINFCGNCPFLISEYDDYSVGHSTLDCCQLARFLNLKEDYISIHDDIESNLEKETPEWCPMKQEDFTFKFREFSDERKKGIEDTKKKITELEEITEDLDIDSFEFKTKNKELADSYSKLQTLYETEEIKIDPELDTIPTLESSIFGPEFTDDFNDQVDDIKEQLSNLNNIGSKLQNMLKIASDEGNQDKTRKTK
jgi:hypothetical protein